jgi:membrane protease YdiL (CAAX protease family)
MNPSIQKIFEISILISCFILPFIIFSTSINSFIIRKFQSTIWMYLLGFLLFSILPILYDFIYNQLGWMILVRIFYLSFLFFALYNRNIHSLPFAHPFIYLLIFFPLDLDILPGGSILLDGGISLKTVVMGTVPVAFYLYNVVYPLEPTNSNEYGVKFEFSSKHFLYSFLGCIVLTGTVLPTSFFLDFVKFKEDVEPFSTFIIQLLVFFLAVGVPEEFFFRVLFLFVWKQVFPNSSNLKYLLISSIFFGLAHLITPTPGHPAPNYAYCFLATLFGLMYGTIYLKTKQLFHAALVHAMVDSIWLHWFML